MVDDVRIRGVVLFYWMKLFLLIHLFNFCSKVNCKKAFDSTGCVPKINNKLLPECWLFVTVYANLKRNPIQKNIKSPLCLIVLSVCLVIRPMVYLSTPLVYGWKIFSTVSLRKRNKVGLHEEIKGLWNVSTIFVNIGNGICIVCKRMEGIISWDRLWIQDLAFT